MAGARAEIRDKGGAGAKKIISAPQHCVITICFQLSLYCTGKCTMHNAHDLVTVKHGEVAVYRDAVHSGWKRRRKGGGGTSLPPSIVYITLQSRGHGGCRVGCLELASHFQTEYKTGNINKAVIIWPHIRYIPHRYGRKTKGTNWYQNVGKRWCLTLRPFWNSSRR